MLRRQSMPPTAVNMESTKSFEKVLYSRVRPAQSHRASNCSEIPEQLRANVIQSLRGNLKTPPRREASPYGPKCGRSSPSSSNNRLSAATKDLLRTAHNHSPKGTKRK